jgi:hypothetical protein
MKAKDLAKILLEHPESEVGHFEYTGGDTPILEINNFVVCKKGDINVSHDGGNFIENNILVCDLIILEHNPN